LMFKKRNEKIKLKDINQTYNVYNGKFYKKLKIKTSMVGHFFGEFSQTRAIKMKKLRKS
jgi:ribosomal protein S19